MRMKLVILCLIFTASATRVDAFLEDLCQPRNLQTNATLSWCIQPTCPTKENPNRACPVQLAEFGTIKPGRSMIHMDSTYFIAQALGFRSDVAYWIGAYNENSDYAQYAP